jgi:predicted transcriptional regulator
MLNALSPKRLELLRAVHESPARSVKSLAERLGRDYKRVHEDV